MATTRDEHLQWAKGRAAEFLDRGDAKQAWDSFCSDMLKHEETRRHDGLRLGTMLRMNGGLSTVAEARDFIRGFN